MGDYIIQHWTRATTSVGSTKDDAIEITVNNRAATRQAIIYTLSKKGRRVVERSSWKAVPPKDDVKRSNWDFSDIVLHHAGHGYSCVVSTEGAMEQMRKAQQYDMEGRNFADIGYHYALSCMGEILEGRDIRFTGSGIKGANTGRINIVLLENLAVAGEAWTQEYSHKPVRDILGGGWKDIARDAVAFNGAQAPREQVLALMSLIEVLKDFFNIERLGGHREYQVLAPESEGRACPGKYGMEVVNMMRGSFQLKAPA